MKGLKRIAVAAALALVCAVALVAQAQGPGKNVPVGPNRSIDPGSGPIGTPGSDKTIKAHVLALEIAVANLTTSLNNLQVRFSNLSSHVSGVSNLQARFSNLSSSVGAIEANPALGLGPFIHVENGAISGLNGPNIFFVGANVHIVSGEGATDGTLNGLGNLIIGYDEEPAVVARGGTHNLVVGPGHNFSSFGGFVAGANNTVSGHDASVSGGQNNKASGNFSVVSGGAFINATGVNQWAHP